MNANKRLFADRDFAKKSRFSSSPITANLSSPAYSFQYLKASKAAFSSSVGTDATGTPRLCRLLRRLAAPMGLRSF